MKTPWVDLAVDIVGYGVNALEYQSKVGNANARRLGFENAEHEALVFLSSNWCEHLLEILLGNHTDPSDRTPLREPNQIIQLALDHVYGEGAILIVSRIRPCTYIHRTHTRKHGETLPINTDSCDLISRYENLILDEREELENAPVCDP